MTEHNPKNESNMWTKVVLCIMSAVTLLSTGWAASATTGWLLFAKSATSEVARIEVQGTQKAQDLDKRVTVLENTVSVKIDILQRSVEGMRTDLQNHITGRISVGKDSTSMYPSVN